MMISKHSWLCSLGGKKLFECQDYNKNVDFLLNIATKSTNNFHCFALFGFYLVFVHAMARM